MSSSMSEFPSVSRLSDLLHVFTTFSLSVHLFMMLRLFHISTTLLFVFFLFFWMCLGTIVPSLALGLFRTYKVEGCWLLIISILSFFPISLALVRITVCLVSVGHDLTMSFSSQCAMTQDTLFWSKWLIPLPSSFFFFFT